MTTPIKPNRGIGGGRGYDSSCRENINGKPGAGTIVIEW